MSEEVEAGRRDVENRLNNNNSNMCVKLFESGGLGLITMIVIIIMLYSIASCTSTSSDKNALLLLGGFVWLSAATMALYKLVNVYR